MAMQKRKRVAIWGFGRLGREIARIIGITDSLAMTVVAVVDHAPNLVGRAAAELVPTLPPDLIIQQSLPQNGVDLVFHGTETKIEVVKQQVMTALEAGCDVVTGAEWMFNPWFLHFDVAEAIDAAARKAGLRVIGCGINPGFSYEAMPLVLSRVAAGLRSIQMTRITDSSTSGVGESQHVGYGIPYDAFVRRMAEGSVKGHIGFPESIAAVAERLGWKVDRIVETWEPIRAVRPLKAPHFTLAVGDVVAVRQEALAYRGDEVCMRMKLEMHLDPQGYGLRPHEEMTIEADTRTTLTITPATRSGPGAAAVMTSAAFDLSAEPPGIVNFLDLATGGRTRNPSRFRAKNRVASGFSAEVTLS